jgi:phage repressor protein C with HTH and peptisase S24 domain
MFKLLRISGHSMEPALSAGSFVLIWKTKRIAPGNIIAFKRDNLLYIKRVKTITDDELYMLGDNSSDSFDSREFGSIRINDVIGKVIWH